MPNAFPAELRVPPTVIFQSKALLRFPEAVSSLGRRGIIVHGHSLEGTPSKTGLIPLLKNYPMDVSWFCRGTGEATLEEISSVIHLAQSVDADWIAGIGGGSVLDLAKAAAGLFHAKEKPVYYQSGGKLTEKGIPFIAVPTTAGSGSEATPNAVIINPDKKLKLSIRHPDFLASLVILDPELLKSAPASIMAQSGMDALVQAYESYISKNATLLTETLALRTIEMIHTSLVKATLTKEENALNDMLSASFFAGLAFSHSRLGVIHGIAHSLGVLYKIPHGLICAICFTSSIKLNREFMGDKYDKMSRSIGKDLLKRIEDLVRELNLINPFKNLPLIEKETLVRETLQSGSTAANPKPITRNDVEFLLSEIF